MCIFHGIRIVEKVEREPKARAGNRVLRHTPRASRKNGQYPFGHPEISSQRGHTDIDEYSGLIKCTVLLPEKLYHPFLPLRQHGKLTFPLCATCVEEEITETMLDPDGSMELPETSDGPFRDCVKAWLKIKEEASGRSLSCWWWIETSKTSSRLWSPRKDLLGPGYQDY